MKTRPAHQPSIIASDAITAVAGLGGWIATRSPGVIEFNAKHPNAAFEETFDRAFRKSAV